MASGANGIIVLHSPYGLRESLGGFPVAYDDFGTRVASIIQFKALPVEVINRHTIIEGFRRRLRSSPAAPFETRVCQATTGGP